MEAAQASPFAEKLAYARSRWAGPLLLGMMFAAIAAFSTHMTLTVPAKTDLSFPEGAVVARAREAAVGGRAYEDWREWPHQFAPYGPLFYYPAGWLALALPGDDATLATYTAGRILTLAALFGIAGLVFWLGRRIGLRAAWPCVGLGLMLHWTGMLQYVQSFRPDATQVFFSMAALVIAAGRPARSLSVFAALAALSISMWIKPTAWGETLIVALWIARERSLPRTAAIFAAWGALNLLAAWALDRSWDGMLFLNMIGSLDNGWTLDSWRGFFIGQGRMPYMLLMEGAAAISIASLRLERDPARRLVFQAQLATLAVSTIQLLKTGADKNYFLCAFALSSLVAADGLQRLWSGRTGLRPAMREFVLWVGVIPYAAMQLTTIGLLTPKAILSVVRSWEPNPAEMELQQRPGLFLTTLPHLALTDESPPTILDYVQYGILTDRGKLDPNPLLQRIRDRQIDWVALPVEDATPALQGRPKRKLYCEAFWPTLLANYAETERVLDFVVFTPKTPGPAGKP